jgi:GMP synthase-like glutamine amidotransferase
MSHIAVLQHFWCENAGALGQALADLSHQPTTIPLHDGAALPTGDAFDAWLIMGGPMNVDDTDKHPYLASERELIRKLIEDDRPVLGVCLGAQLIARATGAHVYAKRPKEIGMFSVELTTDGQADPVFGSLPNPAQVFQWHGDTFDLPDGAVLLASSERFTHQLFRMGRRVYAMQFHLDCTPEIVRNLCHECPGELAALPVGERFDLNSPVFEAALRRQNKLAAQVAKAWADLF